MTDNNTNWKWSDKPADDSHQHDHTQKRMEHWEEHLAEKDRNPNAKETFDKLTEHAAKPEKSEPEKPAQSDSYSGK